MHSICIKTGLPSVVKYGWNKLVGGYGKVGYLTTIVRFHINPAHPKRHAGAPTAPPLMVYPVHPLLYSCSGGEFIIVVLPLSTLLARSYSPVAFLLG